MHDHTCADCGVKIERRTTRTRCVACAKDHRRKLERERDRRRDRSGRKPGKWTRPCPSCGVTFTRAGGAARCDVCVAMFAAAAKSPKCGPNLSDIGHLVTLPDPGQVAPCEWCGRWFHRRGVARFCSKLCVRAVDGAHTAVTFRRCLRCGDTYCRAIAVPDAGFCSGRCNRASSKRHRSHIKRAKNGGERFTLREIAERDGWKCHLCGGAVPDRAWMARDKDPTIDHLVPVSEGGEHTRKNVALAHNRCNWERGAEGLAQLRLVG